MNDTKSNSERLQFLGNSTSVRSEEETMVVDGRASLTPSQMVEQKLISMRRGSSLLVSQMHSQLQAGRRR